MKLSLLAAGLLAGGAAAQQSAFGQCGGENWTGPTTCVAGFFCQNFNPFFSQCVQGSPPTSIGGPTPTSAPAGTPTTPVTVPTFTPDTGFSKVSGRQFNINGEVGYFTGTNSYWISFLTNNADVDLVMSHLVQTGFKVLRVWGFNDVNATPGAGTVWFQSFVNGQPVVINTGADGLERLDYVVQSAEAHGIQLIINFVNNWTDFGGMPVYCNYFGIANQNDWYTNAPAQAQYQKYISTVIPRYKSSSAIFAWELANEPRCNSCNLTIITNWAATTSAFIKSLDPNHMVTLGDEGWVNGGGDGTFPFSGQIGIDFAANLKIPTLDFGTFHLYPGSWGEPDSWGPFWIQYHDMLGAAAGKPVILEEYGTPENHTITEGPWQAAVLNSTVAADMFWQYGDTLSTGQTSDDGNTIFFGTADYTNLAIDHTKLMLAKNA